ncbi:MAG: GNAT family N-acetyltransferase [bacterium]|nr:GNAT family N-acetyltransferase [bacterium]
MRNPYAIGETIYLRPIEPADAAECHSWLNNTEVRRGLATRTTPHTEASSRAFIASLDPARDQVFAIMTRGDGIHVGTCGLHEIDATSRHARLGMVIGRKDHWGRGFATEAIVLLCQHAFETLNLRRLWLSCYATNDRALRLYRRLGFEVEGRLREHAFIEGQYVDELQLGMLRGELRPLV